VSGLGSRLGGIVVGTFALGIPLGSPSDSPPGGPLGGPLVLWAGWCGVGVVMASRPRDGGGSRWRWSRNGVEIAELWRHAVIYEQITSSG